MLRTGIAISKCPNLFHKAFYYEDYVGNLEPVSGPSGYIICSTIRYDLGDIDGFQFTRFDSMGNVLLTRAFSAGSLVNVMQYGALSRSRSDGTFSFLFGSHPYNGYGSSLRVFNTTAQGDINWNRKIDFTDPSYRFDFVGAMDQAFEETPDGGYLITGLMVTSSASAPVVVRLDSLGNILWDKTYDLHLPSAWHIMSHVDTTGTLLLGFHADSTLEVVSNNCLITRMNSSGSTMWSKRLDGFQGRITGCAMDRGRYFVSAMDSSTRIMQLTSMFCLTARSLLR